MAGRPFPLRRMCPTWLHLSGDGALPSTPLLPPACKLPTQCHLSPLPTTKSSLGRPRRSPWQLPRRGPGALRMPNSFSMVCTSLRGKFLDHSSPRGADVSRSYAARLCVSGKFFNQTLVGCCAFIAHLLQLLIDLPTGM